MHSVQACTRLPCTGLYKLVRTCASLYRLVHAHPVEACVGLCVQTCTRLYRLYAGLYVLVQACTQQFVPRQLMGIIKSRFENKPDGLVWPEGDQHFRNEGQRLLEETRSWNSELKTSIAHELNPISELDTGRVASPPTPVPATPGVIDVSMEVWSQGPMY